MKISVGDKVRFLNEVGGGVVSRTEGDEMVYVLDDDGFEVPALRTEVVIVEKHSKVNTPGNAVGEMEPDGYEFEESDEEGEPKLLLACTSDKDLPGNIRLYLINDSNFFAFYSIGRCNNANIINAYHGTIEPNTKLALDNLAINFVDGVEYECQLVLFRKSKEYTPIKPLEKRFKFSGSKLLKENSYSNNAYLEDKAFLIYLLKDTFERKLEELSTQEIKKAVAQKEQKPRVRKAVRRDDNEILEIDLHIHELLDDTRGMSNKEILEYQLGKFHEIMNENKNRSNRKIVFIHGKGNGVLKSEIIKSLNKKYSWHSYQDASFEQYGFGATMVKI
ncbi:MULTISPECIES: Smr/MutS family protein [unclassified Saccharicrinis]|uniref:Smr/MutS family protein n=1 Tax=unclassified Saccharicrinis TaxID=2646859 RepID=UPI003D339F69